MRLNWRFRATCLLGAAERSALPTACAQSKSVLEIAAELARLQDAATANQLSQVGQSGWGKVGGAK